MADSWRFADLTREAMRNVFGRSARLLPALALAGVLGGGAVGVLTLEQSALNAQIAALTSQGRGVVFIGGASPDRPASISRNSCEALTEDPRVERAGIIVDAGRADATPFAVDAPARRASTTLFPELGEVDVLVGDTLASQQGPFRTLVYDQPFDAIVAPPSREGTGSAFTLTFPLLPADTSASRCAVLLDPFATASELTSDLIAQLEVTGNTVSGQEVLAAASDPVDSYLGRLGRFAPMAFGALGGFATALITRTRTSELAVYRLSGTSTTSLLTLLLLENLLLAGTAAAVSGAAALLLLPQLYDPATAAVGGFALAGCWALVATIASVDIPFRRPTDLAKDR
ncbi:hypothetical protein [Microbacterium sp. Gd 4-13]|uniref:hypothetical protein n=1 Tax=Microbacterium sp. Gd 4-13 TaxID=2173179 RepID=UPI001057C1B2|nr:hypothetical protein [Microbacterium sp. Gd 4-13]